MNKRFVSFLVVSQWASAVIALMYHVRFLLFVNYDAVNAKTSLSKAFYFFTGLGHESFAVFFILDGIAVALLLHGSRAKVVDRRAISRRLCSVYSMVLPGLLLGGCLDILGWHLFNCSGVYTGFPELSTFSLSYTSLIGNMFMLQPFLVPTFGSNSMLFLLSYLFWCFILLVLFLLTTRLRKPYGRCVQMVLLAVVVWIMPDEFLRWAAIWLLGIAVVVLGESFLFKPPITGACVFLAVTLVMSRLLDADENLTMASYKYWIDEYRYFLVAISFATLAWAMYPNQRHETRRELLALVIDGLGGRTRQAASFTFFYHFPIAMLLVAASSALSLLPLIQQPTLERYAAFACLIIACLGFTTIIARMVNAVAESVSIKAQ